MTEVHQILRVLARLFLHRSSCVFLFLFFYQMIIVPGLLAFLQARFFACFFFNFAQSGPFCFNNELVALKIETRIRFWIFPTKRT